MVSDLRLQSYHRSTQCLKKRADSSKGLKVHSLPRNMNFGPNVVVQEFLKRFKPASALIRCARAPVAAKFEAVRLETADLEAVEQEAIKHEAVKQEAGAADDPIILE